MTGLESERINVAARGLGLARAAFEDAIQYAQQRHTFGKPICRAPDDSDQAGRHGHEDRSVAAARLLRRREKRPRRTLRPGSRHGQAVRHRNGGRRVSLEAMRIMGATATRKTFPWSGTTAMRRC